MVLRSCMLMRATMPWWLAAMVCAALTMRMKYQRIPNFSNSTKPRNEITIVANTTPMVVNMPSLRTDSVL